MGSGIDADAPLDYATIQIFPTKNRFEVFICGDDEVEKLAVGLLEQLLPHLPGVHKLYAKGSNAIFKLEVTGELNNAAWFTKSTLNRFLQIAGSPDLVNASQAFDSEISQLEEARKFHVSLYAQGHQDRCDSEETDVCDSIEMDPTSNAEAKIALSDTSKNELLRAMDLRLTALKTEVAAALNHAVGASCSSKEIAGLVEFCEYFGAANLKNSLCKIIEVSQNCETGALLNNKHSSSGMTITENVNKMDEDIPISRPVFSEPPVKYGVSPAKAAKVERQSSTESEESSDSSDENRRSPERSRALARSAAPRRSASPMRRVQIGRTGSRRAAALTIKSLNFYPARERTSSHRYEDGNSCEEDVSEQSSKKPENNVQRMSVQDAINLFERKQKDQIVDVQKKSLSSNKSVLRRWSAGPVGVAENSSAENSILCQQESVSEDSVQLPGNDVVDREISQSSVEQKLESDSRSGCQNPVEPAKVDLELERCEEKTHDLADVKIDTNAAQEQECNGRAPNSVEWSRHKEAELNEMLMKMMESQPVKTIKGQTVKNQSKPQIIKKQNNPSEQRGGFYDDYKEKRDRKLRGENTEKKAEKEAQFKAMQQILDARKAEMATTNVKGVGKKLPSSKPQKSLKNPSPPANIRKESPKASSMKNISSKAPTLPATRKSWPSTPSTRAPVSSPSKTPSGISSAAATPTSRKPQSLPSLPRSNAKVNRPQPRPRMVKETQTDANRSLKGVKEKMQQSVTKSGKTSKTKLAAVAEDCSGTVPSKPSFYNKVTKKNSVVPLESKPFLRKGSKSGPGVGPIMNKAKDSSQPEESSINFGNIVETQENEVVFDASVVVSNQKDQDIVSVDDNFDVATESEKVGNSHQNCGVMENFDVPSTDGTNGFKDIIGSPTNLPSQEDSVISPSAWVEIEEQRDIPSSYGEGASELTSPVQVAPVGSTGPCVRHSLSQMLQEDNNSEPDTVDWGNAENPPAVLYQKDVPKGLKRLLKFARKSKGDINVTGWSSPSVFSEGEEDAEESKAVSKRSTENLLRKAALHSKDHGQQKTSFFEGYERNANSHELPSDQSNIGIFNAQGSNKLHKSHVSTATSTTKATRSFFSLSAFRGSKPNETKFQ